MRVPLEEARAVRKGGAMNEPPARHDPTAITIANIWGRVEAMMLVLAAGAFVVGIPFFQGPLFSGEPQWLTHLSHLAPVAVAYLAVVGPALAWLLYRGCRLGARFDDHGVAVRRLLRTERYSWSEVSHLADGFGESSGGTYWVLDIVLYGKPTVTLRTGTLLFGRARRKTLATIAQIAERYSVPAELTGKPPT
jgi:hypothetical protein